MTLSIVIVNYRTSHVLGNCLDSLAGLRSDSEIIVVDNASSDEGWPALKVKYPQVRFLESKDNRGYPAGANTGIRVSSGRAVVLLNPDTQVSSGALETLSERLMNVEKTGIAGPKVFYADGTLQSREVPKKIPALWDLFCDMFYLNRVFKSHPSINAYYGPADFNYENEQFVGQVHGSCFMVKKEVFEKIGPLDEKFFLYIDEADFCLRAARAGYCSLYVPSASVVHVGGESARKCERRRVKYYYDSLLYFFRKHYGAGEAVLLYMIHGSGSLFRFLTIPLHVLKDRNFERAREHFWTLVYHVDLRNFIRMMS